MQPSTIDFIEYLSSDALAALNILCTEQETLTQNEIMELLKSVRDRVQLIFQTTYDLRNE